MSSISLASKDRILADLEDAAREFTDAQRELTRATEELYLKKQILEKCLGDLVSEASRDLQDIVVLISDPTIR